MNEISKMTDNELDEAVAREVMGLDDYRTEIKKYARGDYWLTQDGDTVYKASWQPTRDIAQAWQVVERMREITKSFFVITTNREKIRVSFFNPGGFWGEHDTAPRAICEAALEAVRSSRE